MKMVGLRYPNPLALLDRTFHGLNLVGSWGDVSPQAPSILADAPPLSVSPPLQAFSLH